MTETLLLTLAEASKLIGLCDKTLREEMNDGLLRYVRIRRTRYLTREDIDDWIRAKREEWQLLHSAAAPRKGRTRRTRNARPAPITLEEARRRLKERRRTPSDVDQD